MTFLLKTIDGEQTEPEEVTSFELTAETSAACAGLRLNFICSSVPGEIVSVTAYSGGRLVFNGLCDRQRASVNENGISVFVYARSSASLLVDNEAVPCEYYMATSRQLWIQNAMAFGFEFGLPELECEGVYRVLKGTSRFGAINDFVTEIYGRGIYVTPENVIKAYEKSEGVKTLDGRDILSASFTYGRSEVLSGIDYKINSHENYSYHLESPLARKNGIKRKRLLNLSSLPSWQRKAKAKRQIKNALLKYKSLEATLAGAQDFSLYDRVLADIEELSVCGEFFVDEITVSGGKNGVATTLLLRSETQEELNNYVA